MTKLSVNVNKIATLRNARGGNIPDVVQVAIDCQLLVRMELPFIPPAPPINVISVTPMYLICRLK